MWRITEILPHRTCGSLPVVEKPEEWPFEMDQLNYDKSLGEVGAGKQVTQRCGETTTAVKLSVRS